VVAAMVAAQLKEIPMAKAKSKRNPTSRANNSKTKAHNGERQTTARNAAPLKSVTVAAHRRPRLSAQLTARRESKKAHLIAMLRAPSGATIEAMARAAKWQPHSVRGFLAGVVRKKLGFMLVSTDSENGRVYRITDYTGSAAA
jgi:Protein of unknown function (DUF3489)